MNKCVGRKITRGTREWADHNVNCCFGCWHACRYCYAKKYALRFGRATEETWKEMRVRQDVVTRPIRKMRGRVMYPTSHDIVDRPGIFEACLAILGKLLESGNEVLVTTKPWLAVVRKIDELFSGYKRSLQYRFTITSTDDTLLKFWEPNASSFQERMAALRYASENGYKTSVSIEPFLDYDPEPLVKAVEAYCTESIWVGKMNYIPREGIGELETPFYESVRRNYQLFRLMEIHAGLSGRPKVRFKDSILNKLALGGESGEGDA